MQSVAENPSSEALATLRNIAIIAHVDHGKTTLVDALLRQTQAIRDKGGVVVERVMDSNELERERGITIFSKNASLRYRGVKINLVDTPGHADFGGEVERILRMVDGALLLVDAKEGPMPQTRFVLRKALGLGLRVVVVINKIDRRDARVDEVLNRTFDLFLELGATDEQADFPVIYACATRGLAGPEPDLESMTSVLPVLDTVLDAVPAPTGHPDRPLQMLTLSLAYDDYRGKLAIGRISNGRLHRNQMVTHIDRQGAQRKVRIADLYTFEGLGRVPCEEAGAGDIVAISGLPFVHIGETIADAEEPEAIETIAIDEPVVKMTFAVNTSPFAGEEGAFCTSRHLRERLMRELETDVALRVEETDSPDRFEVSGRGELHLSILLEKMRREGYEMQVGRPRVIFKEIDGKRYEPTEVVYLEVPEEFSGAVIEKMNQRRGEMLDLRPEGKTVRLEYLIPTRGLIGYRSEFLTDTKGLGILHSINAGYQPYAGDLNSAPRGFLVAWEQGLSTGYALENAEERGVLFIGPQVRVYEGMIVGLNSRPEDMDINVCKAKKLTNMRSSTQDIKVALTPPRILSLEQAIEIIGDDDLVEITPKSIRLRKAILSLHERRRARSQAAR